MTATDKSLDMDAALALFEGKIQGLIATLRDQERPLKGLAGLLDWHFQGAISRQLQQGHIQAKAGDCAYLPLTRNGSTYHLLIVGTGATSPGPLPPEALKNLKKNLAGLKLANIGISRADLALKNEADFKGMPVCILR